MTRKIASLAPIVVAKASNVHGSLHNPDYTTDDFLGTYPQFSVANPKSIEDYICLCNGMLSKELYGCAWKRAMSLAIAHFLTLDLMTQDTSANPTVASIVAKAKGAIGVLTSKSVGDVSASYSTDYLQSLNSWGTWNLTIYGQQFASLAKLMGKAGMYVW